MTDVITPILNKFFFYISFYSPININKTKNCKGSTRTNNTIVLKRIQKYIYEQINMYVGTTSCWGGALKQSETNKRTKEPRQNLLLLIGWFFLSSRL